MTTTTAISAKAQEAYGWFETATRPNGDSFVRVKDGAPDWVTDLVYDAHGDFLPDDWRYACIRSALDWLAGSESSIDDANEFADGEVDAYTANRFAWLSSNLSRQAYVDEAVDEFGAPDEFSIADAVGLGQYMEAQEVYQSVLESLTALAGQDEETSS